MSCNSDIPIKACEATCTTPFTVIERTAIPDESPREGLFLRHGSFESVLDVTLLLFLESVKAIEGQTVGKRRSKIDWTGLKSPACSERKPLRAQSPCSHGQAISPQPDARESMQFSWIGNFIASAFYR